MTFSLSSAGFAANAAIPARYTCDGQNVSPPLAWSDAPAETNSFALICDDPDAPGGVWFHWAIYDVPASARSFPEGFKAGPDVKQGVNDFRRNRYDGPCPPRGHGRHHYRFKLFALSVGTLALKGNPHCRDVEKSARAHALAMAELTGIYARGG